MSELLRLAERCEQATGADRQLDNAIANATSRPLLQGEPFYTASLDAAITLVPEGCDCSLWWGMRGGKLTSTAEIDGVTPAIAATRALALCAAALRARAATKGEGDKP